ncbi:MAG: hypothetical protein J6F30_01315 [Cellulosilyticum sp.]|nr:hypothetical protein [Cellulosilyticum sp.]
MQESLFRPKILPRERINNLLEAIFETPLFYLSASMGYGKTTAIRCFLEEKKDIKTVWIPISSVEGNENGLWHRFGDAMEKYSSEAKKQLLSIGFPTNDYEIRSVLEIVKEVVNEPMVIVFDDYHEAECQPILDRILTLYTEDNMKNVHVVVISRMRPSTNFLMLNIKNKCLLMWQGEIAFTKQETNDLFELNGFKLTHNQIDEVYNYTMGWSAPTYLLLLEYAIHKDIGIITESTELIKAAVYDQLDEDAKRLLLMLAPLDSFSLELGEYITQTPKVSDVIKDMLMKNCFISLIPQSKDYQFHTLFKHTLLDELRKSDIEEKEIYNRCALWYKSQGVILTAIEYFDKARNDDAILDIMSQLGATEYMYIAPKLITNVFSHMSLEKKLSRPIGYLTFIQSYLLSTYSPKAYKLFDEAKAYYLEHEEIKQWQHIRGEIYLIEALLLVSKPHQMLEYIKRAYEDLDQGKSLIAGPVMICTRGRIHSLSMFYNEVGKYRYIRDFMEENLKYFKQVANGCSSGMRYLACAEYAYDIGNLEESKVFAYKAIYRAEIKKQLSVLLNAHFVLMRISIVQGNIEEIDQHMEEINQHTLNGNHPIIRNMVDMVKGYIYGITNKYQKVPEWIKNISMERGIDSLPDIRILPINLGLILLYKKEYIQLEVLMESCIEEYKKNQSIYEIMLSYILLAIAKVQLYDEDDGAEALQEAIKIAEADQIIMPFIEFRKYIKELMEILAEQSDFAKRIVEYYKMGNLALEKENNQELQEILTDREKDVMQLFVKGYKQSEVARELQITIDTVKRHIKNVYAKLNIHSKAELIEKLGNTL